MKNHLAIADALSNSDLLTRIPALARHESETCAELVAHLAALEARPAVYLEQGYGSLFGYCREALHLTEDVASNRVAAARFCRQFPIILPLLGSGEISLSALRVLGPHLTAANHVEVLERSRGRSRREAEVLAAGLAPRPDAPSTIRSVSTKASPSVSATQASFEASRADDPAAAGSPVVAPRPPIIQPTSPRRFRVEFTIGQDAHDALRRLQALLRREIPSGDVGLIFDYMTRVTLEKVERTKLGRGAKPRAPRAIRPGADETDRPAPRRPVAAVRAAVTARDHEQCSFVSTKGRRCTETVYLEFDHREPYARGGGRTAPEVRLLCRRHNQYESERIFGPWNGRKPPVVRERVVPYGGR